MRCPEVAGTLHITNHSSHTSLSRKRLERTVSYLELSEHRLHALDILLAELRQCVVVRCKLAGQPHHFYVYLALAFHSSG